MSVPRCACCGSLLAVPVVSATNQELRAPSRLMPLSEHVAGVMGRTRGGLRVDKCAGTVGFLTTVDNRGKKTPRGQNYIDIDLAVAFYEAKGRLKVAAALLAEFDAYSASQQEDGHGA